MEKMVANKLMLQRLECVSGIGDLATVQPRPIDKIGPAGSTSSTVPLHHLLRCLEAVQIVRAIRGGATDFERWRFLKFKHVSASL
jgi:hypothetical protein